MDRWKGAHDYEQRLHFITTQIALAGMAAAAVAPIALLAFFVPRVQVLPILCLLALAAAGAVALFAWWRGAPRRSDHVTSWDVAGALAFIGFAAGMLSDADAILHLFGHETMAN